MIATLALENGTWFTGTAAGALGEARGEVVFNTSMTGYQEVLTDPSYAGQIVTMTCPQIGNYGVAKDDVESRAPQVAGFVMREESPVASNWRAQGTLTEYLARHGIVAIADIDTRALTRMLRSVGVMRGIVATGDVNPSDLVDKARGIPQMEGSDLVRSVTCERPFDWVPEPTPSELRDLTVAPERRARRPSAGSGRPELVDGSRGLTVDPELAERVEGRRLKIAAYDFGMKWNILRRFAAYGCDVRVFPATAPAADVLASKPDGVFLSNGPGDPAALDYAIANVQAVLAAKRPVFGICLGHQLLGLAMGARTFKLKFGHRGANHPVKQLETGQVEITSQNHGFAVDPASLPADTLVTHVNLYDGTLEGFRHKTDPVFGVQYHPEASPGPHDADYLFRRFMDEIEKQ